MAAGRAVRRGRGASRRRRSGAAARPVVGSRGRRGAARARRRSSTGRWTSTAASRLGLGAGAGRGTARRSRARAARGAPGGATPAPDYPGGARFAVALTHDIDTPWRWSRRGVLGAAARLKGALGRRDVTTARVEATGLALAPLHRSSAATPTGRIAASPRAERRPASAPPASCSRRTAIRTTAPPGGLRRAPRAARGTAHAARPRGRPACQLHLPGRRAPARARSAPCSPACSAGRSPATATTTCAALARRDPRARPPRLLVRHDARARRTARPARRALVPVPALGRRRRAAAAHHRAPARPDGRDAGRGALPRALPRRRLGARSSACWIICTTSAGARACSGTTIASTASTGAAGTGSTIACSTASWRAEGTPARRAT